MTLQLAHADALAVLSAWQGPDEAQARLRAEFVDFLNRGSGGLVRSNPDAHLTSGAVVVGPDGRLLLNHHRKLGLWIHFGGHFEPTDESLLTAVQREVREEAGLSVRVDPVPVHLGSHRVSFCGTGGPTWHHDIRFVAYAPADAQPFASEESHEIGWFDPDNLPTDEPEMLALVAAARLRAGLV